MSCYFRYAASTRFVFATSCAVASVCEHSLDITTQAKASDDGRMPLLGFELSRTAADPLASCLAGGKPGTARFFSAALAAGDYARHRPSLQHLALRMRSRAAGQTVYETVQAMGSPVLDQRGHDVPFTTQTRLNFDVILPLWGRRGPR